MEIDSKKLLSFVERIEYLETEKEQLSLNIKEIFIEAKNANFDVKAIKECIKLRKIDCDVRDEQDVLIEAYRQALNI